MASIILNTLTTANLSFVKRVCYQRDQQNFDFAENKDLGSGFLKAVSIFRKYSNNHCLDYLRNYYLKILLLAEQSALTPQSFNDLLLPISCVIQREYFNLKILSLRWLINLILNVEYSIQ